ncbi:hypothetical protein ACJEDT_18090 [Rhodococcoides fascians]|uniref:hypothetical protein n=1 Tax=Rhodococcoides fascians TaxID=1828 RepID=UPI0038999B81
MRKSLRRAVVATALTVPLVFGLGAGTAAAAPQVTNLQVPAVTGFQIAPGAVPGGLFQTIPMKAIVGDEPGVARFSAANTGPGPVVVTVTHTKDYSNGGQWGSPYLDTLLPGAGVVLVP